MVPNPESAAYRLLAADELGLLKAIEVPAGPKWDASSVVQKWGQPDRSRAVQELCCCATSFEPGIEALVAAGRAGGSISILDAATGADRGSCKASTSGRPAEEVSVSGLAFLTAQSHANRQPDLLSINSAGELLLHTAPDPADSAAPWALKSSFQTASNVLCMALDIPQRTLALGGEGCNLSLWDLATQQKTWQAKGNKPNRVGLVDKPFLTAAAFLPDGGERQRVLVGTAGHKLMLYDAAAGRRPQLEVSWGDARVTALAAQADGARVWAANGAGTIAALDLRSNTMQGALKGPAGSVRALALHPTQPLIASVGLDRFLRVHSTETRAPLGRVYLKQQLTGVVWVPPVLVQQQAGAKADAGGEQEGAPATDPNAHDAGSPQPAHKRKGRKQASSKSKKTKQSVA